LQKPDYLLAGQAHNLISFFEVFVLNRKGFTFWNYDGYVVYPKVESDRKGTKI
jgi:hypothetical protein